MNDIMYDMIFKRKSFHLFRDVGDEKITLQELSNIKKQMATLKPLIENIKVDMKVVPAEETNCKRGEEYCILLYSEKKDNYLQNIGYIGEQLDLYLTSLNIGTLWFGFGKTEQTKYNNLDFIIMIAIKKVPEDKFRKDMFKSKRKSIEEIWLGDTYLDIANIVRFTPSSCNTQPWKVISTKNSLEVFRYKEPGKKGMMPLNRVTFSNRIDIGIFLLFLELCLKHNDISYNRTIHDDTLELSEEELTKVATYNFL